MDNLPQLLIEAQMPEQPELFLMEPDAGKELLALDEPHEHTGKTLERRRQLAEMVCNSLLAGISMRDCAKRFRVGRNTIAAFMSRLEAEGKVEPFKRRMSKKLALLAELANDALLERAWEGKITPIEMAVVLDKKALLDGDPTSIVGSVYVNEKLTPENINGFWERLKIAKPAVAIEAESSVFPCFPYEKQ